MAHPATRVLAVLGLLQARGRIGGAELAKRVNVDARTIRRYITTLQDLGIPIATERGRYGAYMLVPGYKLPPMMFTNDEALALSIGLLAARTLGLAEGDSAVASAQAKLERVIPPALKGRVRDIGDTVKLDLSRAQAARGNDALAALVGAAQARQRVHLHYRSAKGEVSERDFDTYGLVYRRGKWYASGYCHLRLALRSLRLDRITDAVPVDARFERPADFDAAVHLSFSIARMPRGQPVEILLYTDLKAATQFMGEHIGLYQPCEDGVLLRSSTADLDWFARQLARSPCRFEVRTPSGLRDAVRSQAWRLLQWAVM